MPITGRIPSLDGFRCISICLVVGSHVAINSVPPNWLKTVLELTCFGELGVRFFFVISGFLITYLLLDERNKNEFVDLKAFYARRFLRIFPVFYAYLIVVTILNHSMSLEIPAVKIVSAALYLQNFAPWGSNWFVEHSWSLAVEEQFYLIWPVIFIRIRDLRNFRAWIAILILGSLMRSIHYKFPELAGFVLAPFFMHADFLFSGCFMAFMLFNRENYLVALLKRAKPLLVYIAILVIWILSQFEFDPVYDVIFIPTAGTVINICICFLIVYFVFKTESLGYKILNSRGLVYVGKLSYSLYVWQQLFISPIDTWWTRYPYCIFFTSLAAVMSYQIIEKPFLTLKDRFRPPNAIKKSVSSSS